MGQVNQPSDVNSEIRELKRQVQELTKRVGLSSAVISRGGLTITDGGKLTVRYPSGTAALMMGDVVDVDGGGSQGFGLLIQGDDPSYDIFRAREHPTVGRQVVIGETGNNVASTLVYTDELSIRDGGGHQLIATDTASGAGLARPYLNYRIVPSFSAESSGTGVRSLWPSTTSGSAAKVMQGINTVWHPRVSVGILTSTDGGGNVAWRLEVNGSTAASGTGGGSQTVSIPGWGSAVNPGSAVGFDLYANTTGGATRAYIQCDRLYGTQS